MQNNGDSVWRRSREQNLARTAWQRFLYLNEPAQSSSNCGSDQELWAIELNVSNQGSRSLASTQVGDRVCIVSLNCGESNHRLMGMGLIPGAVLEVVSSRGTGSVIVALQDQRLGLGVEIARQIQITPVTPLSESEQAEIDQARTDQEQPTCIRSTPMSPSPQRPTLKLRDVAIGATLRVVGYEPTARDYKRKLLAMGLTPGTELIVKRHAPLGDPTEIEVRDFHLSLRKAEADALIVETAMGETV